MSPRRRLALLALLALLVGGLAWVGGRVRRVSPEARPAPSSTPPSLAGATAGDGLPVPTLAGARSSAEDPSVPVTLAVFGRVVDAATREPVAGARISALGPDGSPRGESVSGADGSFRVGVRDPSVHLLVEASGHAPAEILGARPRADPIEVALARGGWIEGRVLDRGAPSSDARVAALHRRSVARPPVGGTWLQEEVLPPRIAASRDAATDGGGRFRVGPLAAGTYALRIEIAGRPVWLGAVDHAWDADAGVVVREGAVVDVGDLAAPRVGTVLVRVVDASDRPVPHVEFQAGAGIDRRDALAAVRPLSVASDGTHVLPVLLDERGRMRSTSLTARSAGYGPWSTSFAGQEDGERFVARLVPSAAVEGTVGPAGRPERGAAVFVRRDGDEVVFASAVVGDDGRFAIEGLPAGVPLELVAVDATGSRAISCATLALAPGETRRLSLGGGGPAIQGVVRVDGVPLEGAFVFLDAPDGRRSRGPATGRDGGFRFDALAPGLHEIYVTLRSRVAGLRRAVRVEEHGVADLPVDLAFGIEGVVAFDPPASAADDREVTVLARRSSDGDGGDWVADTRTGADGRFHVRLPGPGTWFLSVEPPTWRTPRPVRVEAPASDAAPPARVPAVRDSADGEIVLEVRDEETGEPVEDGGYRYAWENVWGSGSVPEDGVVEARDAGLGTHRYVFDSPAHVDQEVLVEITHEARSVRRVVALGRSTAVRVERVEAGSNADRGGIVAGDVLRRHGDRPLRTVGDLRAATAATRPEDEVRVEGLREGVARTWDLRGGRMGVEAANAAVDAR